MKNENVFENDAPTIEMETRTLRPTQQGYQIPFAGGFSINPYTGAAINPAYAPQSQQQGFVNVNGITAHQMNPQYIHPAIMQNQPPLPYGNSYLQPVSMGVTPGYFGNAFPNPYINSQYQGNVVNPATPQMPGQWFGNPFTQQMPGQFAGMPATQPNFGTMNPMHPSPYYQPAINIADGQLMLLPNQNAQGATKNGTSYAKNSERDFISWFPTVNILETERSFKIEICVPGVTKENCRINVDKNNILRASGSRRWNQETDTVGFTRKEFNYGSFACSFLLTDNLQKEKITSSCRNGLLIISIPKQEGNEGEDRSFSDISVN